MKCRIAIIVVTYNNQQHIDGLIASVKRFYDLTKVPLVIVDNASTDGTVEEVTARLEPGITLVKELTNHGFGVGNNIGFRQVAADYYFLLNSDAYFIEDSLSDALDVMDEKQEAALAGLPLVFPDGSAQTYNYPSTTPLKLFLLIVGAKHALSFVAGHSSHMRRLLYRLPMAKNYLDGEFKLPIDISHPAKPSKENVMVLSADWVCGASMLLRGDFVRATRGFDPDIFMYGEDEDLCITAKRQGYDVLDIGVTPIVHEFGWGKNKKKSHHSEVKLRSLLYFCDKHYTGFSRICMRLMMKVFVKGWVNAFKW